MEKIPYGRQMIDEEDIEAVVGVLRSDFLTTGPKVAEFEKMVSHYTGVKYAVAVSNGTAALHAACYAAGIQKGDEVIVPAITFAASANCVLYCGGTPVFADVDEKTYNIDPEEIKKNITEKTKAIIAVHLAGQPCDMDAIHKIAREKNLLVIEDAAHALGAEYKGKKIGGLSDLTTFSFHPVKPITTGEGGMILTDDETLYRKLVLFRSHGIAREEGEFVDEKQGDWYYEQVELGYNYRITDIQCALGCSQMKKLDRYITKRRELAERYTKAFKDNEDLITPFQMEEGKSGWHLYIIQVLNHDRAGVFKKLREAGILVNVHYMPVYMHPYYRRNGYAKVCCKNAEEIYAHMISLPLYPGLSFEQQDHVIEQVKYILKNTKNDNF